MSDEVMSERELELEVRARRFACALVARAGGVGRTVATAESLTAGLVAATIASVPGASEVLRGGAITYCDEIKHEVLGVSEDTLSEHTAVSAPTALEMAHGARERFGTDLAVSLTGYAGPTGGTEVDPAGTVYIATCCDSGEAVRRFSFVGARNEVRLEAVCAALQMLDALL